MHRFYPALIHKDQESDYGISFPDLPGCVSAGSTPEETFRMGAEALQLHIDGILEDGEPLPDPTHIEDIDIDDAVMVSMIGAVVPGKKKRVQVTLDEGIVNEIDTQTSNRSGFLEEAARKELAYRRTA